jgi:hypothetical protein
MVYKKPSSEGYATRHAILSVVPCALLFVSFFGVVFKSLFIKRIVLCFCIILFSYLSIRNQILWQARYIQCLSIVENLKMQKEKVKGNIVIFRDIDEFWMPNYYRDYEINWMLKHAFGNEKHFGAMEFSSMDLYKNINENYKRMYMISDYKKFNGTSYIKVIKRMDISELNLFFKYVFGNEKEKLEKNYTVLQITNSKRYPF